RGLPHVVGCGGRRHEVLEPHGVDRLARQLEAVAARGRGDDIHRQLRAEPRDERLQRGSRVLGRVVGPDVFGDRAIAEVRLRLEGEPEQQRALPVPRDLDGLTRVLDGPAAQDPNPHRSTLEPWRGGYSTASAVMGLARVLRRDGVTVATRVSTAAATTTIATITHGTPGSTMPGIPFAEPSSDCAPAHP